MTTIQVCSHMSGDLERFMGQWLVMLPCSDQFHQQGFCMGFPPYNILMG